MRIALVSTEVGGIHNGGIGTYVIEAAHALSGAGHEVWLVTYLPESSSSEVIEQLPGFARVLFVEDCPSATDPIRFGLARVPLRFAQLAHEMLRDAGVAFDLIEFADYGANGAVAVAEQRLFGSHGDAVVTVTLHSPTYDCWLHNESTHIYGPSEREVAALEHETIRTAPVVRSPSRNLRDAVCDRLGMDPTKISVVRYPMRLAHVPTRVPATGRTLAELKFVYCGRIEPRKGVREIAAAFARMPDLQITCIGRDGNTAPLGTSETANLQRIGGNLTFLDDMPRDELLATLQTADVVVLPSRWDNWPNVCLEAMAAGCIVIGGDNSGMAEMIEHGRSGFLVESGNATDLERVIREDLQAAMPHLDSIARAAAARSRELCDPAVYVQAVEQLVQCNRGNGQWLAAPKPRTRVSIVVPYYREDRELIHAAVQSAIAQTHRDLEILIVEDGSPRPDAKLILAELAQLDDRIRVLHKPNGGVASARNFAIEHATGDFILCLDADNLLRTNYAELGLDVLSRSPDAVAMVPRFQAFLHTTKKPSVIVQAMPFDRPLALFRNSLGDSGAMFRREVFSHHGLRYDSVVDCYSDWALWLDIAKLGLRVQVAPRTLYDYRIREDSMMAEHAWQNHLALLGLLIERHLPDGDEHEMLVTLVQGWGVGALLAALGNRHEWWEQPQATGRRLEHRAAASELFAQAFDKLGQRRPRIGRIGASLVRFVARWHGKYKKRRET